MQIVRIISRMFKESKPKIKSEGGDKDIFIPPTQLHLSTSEL